MNAKWSNQTKAPEGKGELGLAANLLQRKCACGQHTIGGAECQACGQKPLQRQATSATEGAPTSSIIEDVLSSPGQSLNSATRASMESHFNRDFSHVRVHTDMRAAESARSVNALAYTVGSDIVFGANQYSPESAAGRRLLAHELTHTVQQQGGGVHLKGSVSEPRDGFERHADDVAQRVSEGQVVAPLLNASGAAPAASLGNDLLLQRQAVPAPATSGAAPAAATALPAADVLTTRIATCIGIWETNRGQNAPAPKESSLDTVAGVHASMATIEQATMPYAITALKNHQSLRDAAVPPLTVKELNDAEARVIAVTTLLSAVSTAAAGGQTPDAFIKANTAAIQATGLSDADVTTMFSAVTLKSTLDTARTNMDTAEATAKQAAADAKKSPKEQAAAGKAARSQALTTAIAGISTADRLGLGEGSLKAYINKPTNWGENRAGWQRKAVAAMPNNVGSRIETVAVSNSGTALAIPVVRSRVDAELAKTPVPSLEDIVKTVAQKNNPNEANYGANVWATYQRVFP